MCKSIDDGSPVNESPTDQSIMDPLSIDGFSALWIPVSVNPLQIDLGIPSAIYTLIEGSPPLYTDQSRDPLRYIQINLGIPSAIHKLIEGSPPLYTDQLRDPLRYIQINLGIPSVKYRSM